MAFNSILKEKLDKIASKMSMADRMDLLCERAERLTEVVISSFPLDKHEPILRQYAEVAFAMYLVFPEFDQPEFSDIKYNLYHPLQQGNLFQQVIALASLKLARFVHRYNKFISEPNPDSAASEADVLKLYFKEITDAMSCNYAEMEYDDVLCFVEEKAERYLRRLTSAS